MAYFEQRTDDVVALLRQLVEIESPSTDRKATNAIGEAVAGIARSTGASVSTVAGHRRGDHVVARWGDDGPGFLILCHLDTVWSVGTLQDRPWRLEAERAYGPGCLDNKSGAAVALMALMGLRGLSLPPCLPVTAVFNSDEEVGSRTSRKLIEEQAERAELVICMEPAMPDGSLKAWRKGTGRYTVCALGHAVHAGSDHEMGINAIEELSHQVLRLQAMTDYAAGTTVSVGWARGGTRTNVVPERAEARVDLRVTTPEEGARMDAAIKDLRPVLPGSRLVVEGELSRPPMERSPLTLGPFVRVQQIAAEIGIELGANGSGGASDANFTAAIGVPTLDGLGAIGDGAHSVEEYVRVPSLAERSALLAAILTRWARGS